LAGDKTQEMERERGYIRPGMESELSLEGVKKRACLCLGSAPSPESPPKPLAASEALASALLLAGALEEAVVEEEVEAAVEAAVEDGAEAASEAAAEAEAEAEAEAGAGAVALNPLV
jgi:hypothetical protein